MDDQTEDDTAPETSAHTGRPPHPQPSGTKGEGNAGKGGSAPPAAGPHADPDLTDADKTPGAGTLPPVDGPPDQDSNAG